MMKHFLIKENFDNFLLLHEYRYPSDKIIR